MNDLKQMIAAYLDGPSDEILITDQFRSYTRAEVAEKVSKHQDRLSIMWSENPQRPRGVAILLDRTVDYLAVIFASWLADGFYLPLNLASPKNAIDGQIAAAGITVLCERSPDAGITFRHTDETPLPATAHDIFASGSAALAYIIFTSGSTGEKKGVAISKASFAKYVCGVKAVFDGRFVAGSVLINGELTFDITLADFAFAIVFRTEICITSQASNLLSLCALAKRRNVESIYAVPSTWEKILDLAGKIDDLSFAGVRNIFSGGEALSYRLVARMREICPDALIFNMYGPTEFTVNAFYWEIAGGHEDGGDVGNIPLGHAFPDVGIAIANQIAPDEGELYLSGPQIMQGYVNAAAPFTTLDGKIYYATGDLVRRDAAGIIHYVGRLRDYEKVSGYRINLLSIEEKIRMAADADLKLLIVDGKILCVVVRSSGRADANIRDSIRTYASADLEVYEAPAKIVFVDSFPLNSSGKLDRQQISRLIS